MSLYIDNFSILKDEVRYCTALIDFGVDVFDDTNNVTLSGTYLTCNDVSVPFSTNNITNGYRLTYSTLPSGTLVIKVFASNDNNEFFDKTFVMQYGYEVVWDKVVYWGPNKEVPVAVIAKNSAIKPNTNYFSTFFVTNKYKNVDLEVLISVDGSGYKDLYTNIRPQSKYFMYGKSYSITISGVKDFSGNIMLPRTFNFTLEENPNIR